MKNKYYSLKAILARGAHYNMIFGERSSGKTTAILEYGLRRWVEQGEQMAYLRRWDEEFVGKRGSQLFADIVQRGVISKLTRGEWTGVKYYASKWYLTRIDATTEKQEIQEDPFCYGFALSTMEHDKSISFPNVTTVFFDEFLTRFTYLQDEFILFCNTLSTIIRQRKNVTIFMAGNTVTKYCPYFAEMGLTEVKKMKPGDIDVYTYGDSGLLVAVEYAEPNVKGKDSDVYFAFKNPKLQMITTGAWELAIYPHCPVKYVPADILATYFIVFEGDILQCEIIRKDDLTFTFIHRKTTPLKNPEGDLIYSPEYTPRPNWRRKITKPQSRKEKVVASFFAKDKVFYQDNEVGEIVRNYVKWCATA